MTPIEAIYEDGVFKPLHVVDLPDRQRVRLSVEAVKSADAMKWLREVQDYQQQFIARHGSLPDSTPEIAADRMRRVPCFRGN